MKKLTTLCFLFITLNSIAQNNTNVLEQNNNQLHFDGVDDWVDLNVLQDDFYATSSTFTVEFWMKADKDLNTSSIRTSMFAINEPAGENRLLIILGGSSAQDGHLMIYPDGSWGPNQVYESTEVIGDNVCHHIAYSFDGTNGRIYIDGVLKDTHPTSYTFTASDRFSLGQEWDNLVQSQFYNGILDDLRIWDHVRTGTEIANNMDSEMTGSEPGMLAYYNFNQGIHAANNAGITTLNDLGPNNQDGTLDNFALNGATSNWLRSLCSNSIGIEENSGYTMFNVYPNPTTDVIHFNLDATKDQETNIMIYDLLGQMVYNKPVQLIVGANFFKLERLNISTGTYFISIPVDGHLMHAKLTIAQ